ncbi:hypothetical protein [Pedobacter sp. SYP-B3415]|uniref:hypothetical protein n=1 Tax=Pedobacter sp. SYP-B3415 TaxID=2496641 RepID=UPI00101CE4B1|nr:hypothetical protein [Pedobacter sp. SYP-B3415]
MVRKSVAILLLFAVLTAQFSMSFVFAGFELNRDYIAKTLCVNRDKPELNCKGKCFLMDKVRKAQQKEDQQSKQTQKNLMQETFHEGGFAFRCHVREIQTYPVPHACGSPRSSDTPIFHPPRLV